MVQDQLKTSKAAILRRWLDLIFASYPNETNRFLRREKDRFQNPVGHTLIRETEVLFDALLESEDISICCEPIDNIVRIRAVQDFAPSQAVHFVYLLKRAIRDELDSQSLDPSVVYELPSIDTKIDQLALIAFDSYMRCREKISEIRINEIKRASAAYDRMRAQRPEPAPNQLINDINTITQKKGGDGS
jgi:hypothetical protein